MQQPASENHEVSLQDILPSPSQAWRHGLPRAVGRHGLLLPRGSQSTIGRLHVPQAEDGGLRFLDFRNRGDCSIFWGARVAIANK